MSGWVKLLVPSLLLGAACVLPAAAAPGAPGTYETVLGPTPINHTTKTSLVGEGAAVATLTGNTLKISGTFQGMSGAASDAHIMMGEAIGIPGGDSILLTIARRLSRHLPQQDTLARVNPLQFAILMSADTEPRHIRSEEHTSELQSH